MGEMLVYSLSTVGFLSVVYFVFLHDLSAFVLAIACWTVVAALLFMAGEMVTGDKK